jgi:hypothetical protein
VTRDSALDRARKLLALAAEGNGAAEGERRNAAVAAGALIVKHGLLDGGGPSAIDIDQVTALAIHAAELEHQLDDERRRHAEEVRQLDRRWNQVVAGVRAAERQAARAERKRATRKAVTTDRANLGAEGGRARDRKLSDERKREIGRQGARARWTKWRERHANRPQ